MTTEPIARDQRERDCFQDAADALHDIAALMHVMNTYTHYSTIDQCAPVSGDKDLIRDMRGLCVLMETLERAAKDADEKASGPTTDADIKIFDLIAQRDVAVAAFEATSSGTPEANAALDRFNAIALDIAKAEPRTVRGYAAKVAVLVQEDAARDECEPAAALIKQAGTLSGMAGIVR